MLRLVHHSERVGELAARREKPSTSVVDLEARRADLATRRADFAVRRGKRSVWRGKRAPRRTEGSPRSTEAFRCGERCALAAKTIVRLGAVPPSRSITAAA